MPILRSNIFHFAASAFEAASSDMLHVAAAAATAANTSFFIVRSFRL
jgi:hypothetical protein